MQNREPLSKLANAFFRYGVPAELGDFEKGGALAPQPTKRIVFDKPVLVNFNRPPSEIFKQHYSRIPGMRRATQNI